MSYKKVISAETISNLVKEAKYAVRGPIVIRAGELQEQLAKGEKLPFTEITQLNVGNPQILGQHAQTFNREVMACMLDDSLMTKNVYSEDVIKRVKEYKKSITNIGAYSASQGFKIVRDHIVKYMEKRDKGIKANPDEIFLTNGAGEGVEMLFKLIASHPNDGIMIPIPQYPLYSALCTLYNVHLVGYYLDEVNNWQLNISELEKQFEEAKKKGIHIKTLVVINPGNPTGAVLSEQNIKDVIGFAYKHNISIIADEVYQENIYCDKKEFISFKYVLRRMEDKIAHQQELFSCHSCSKGMSGECGLRGGYLEVVNMDKEAWNQLLKLKSISLCSSTVGMLAVDLMVYPPNIEEGYSQKTVDEYHKEKHGLFQSLKNRAVIVEKTLNECKNVKCNPIEGAMYAFPQITFSQKAIEAAKKLGQEPDVMYCSQLLEQTGIVTVAGSGFKQLPETHHLRLTILVQPEDKLKKVLEVFKHFNNEFHHKFE